MIEEKNYFKKLPVNLSDVYKAYKLLNGIVINTQMQYSHALSKKSNSKVYLKCENLQKAGSFKVRGSYNMIYRLLQKKKCKQVVAASAGNHAQGVALAAKKLGIKATIYMPIGVALPKLLATKELGAKVKLFGSNVDEALIESKKYSKTSGSIFVHPFDNADVVAGQGTVGIELMKQIPNVSTILVGVGGGGLIAGISIVAKTIARNEGKKINIIGVQAENAAAYPPSLAADALVPLKKISTIADGIAVGKPGQIPFKIIKKLVDDVITVSEESLARALIFLLEKSKLVVEPAGAVGVAALLDGKIKNSGQTVVILSGGNIDPMLILKVIQRGLSAAGRFLVIKMMLNDRPGMLAKISKIIAKLDANVTGVEHNRIGGSISIGDVSITINIETKGVDHCNKILHKLKKANLNPVVVAS